MCNCIKEYQEYFRKETGDPFFHFDLEYDTIQGEIVFFVPIYAFYRDVRQRDGKVGKRTKHKIIPEYCPFCGEKTRIGEREDLIDD